MFPFFHSSFPLFFIASEPPVPQGEVNLSLYPLLATTTLGFFTVMPSQNLFLFDANVRIYFDELMVTCWTSKALKVEAKTNQSGFQNRSKNEAKTNMGNNAKTIRMRGAGTSQTMLPSGRGAHLHKSANLKMVFEKIQTIHNNDAKIVILNHPKHDAEEKYRAKIPQLKTGASCVALSRCGAFVVDNCLFFPNL